MDKKILWIVHSYKFSGGAVVQTRNYKALCSIYGNENVEIFNLAYKSFEYPEKPSIFYKVYMKCSSFIYSKNLIHFKTEDLIIDKSKDFDIVFIDRSIYGTLAKRIKKKKRSIKIASFFHNVELDFHKDLLDLSLPPFENWAEIEKDKYLKKIYLNEKMICKYSDITIALNSRDAEKIEQVYGKKIDALIPVSFKNREINFNKNPISKIPTALFYGSNFPPNVHAIHWFVENVLPFVNIKFQIIMKDVEKENLPPNDKMELLGFVEDLDAYVQNADFVVFPIFKGSGMKVKTCEALMHGKNILGTSEAFMGYDVDFNKVGTKCETAEEFIQAINEFSQKFECKFNEYSRNVFLEKYTDDVAFERFENALKIL